MTTWLGWVLVIFGPVACAVSGGWVMRRYDRRAMAAAAESMYEAGRIEGRYRAWSEMADTGHDDTTMLIDTGHFAAHSDHRHWCPGCLAGDGPEPVAVVFEATRARLGHPPEMFPRFDDHQAAWPLAPLPASAVSP